MLVILSGHVVGYQDINCQTYPKPLFPNYHNFVDTSTIFATEDYDRSYIVFDSKKGRLVKTGTAATGTV